MSILHTVQGMIDATIRNVVPGLVRGQDTALGTLVSRDVSGLTGSATFDPSSTPAFVKLSGSVHAVPGDKVAMVRTGGYWTVVAALTTTGLGETFAQGAISGGGTKGDATYADIPGAASMTGFRKAFDATGVHLYGMVGMYTVTAVNTIMRIAFRVTGETVAGDAYDSGDLHFGRKTFSTTAHHHEFGGAWRSTGTNIPAGTYTITPRWRRDGGTGSGQLDGNDWYTFLAQEYRRQP